MTEKLRRLRATLPATLGAVEEFCARFRACRDENGSATDWFVAELLLREALINAVVHGCYRNPASTIECRVQIKPDALTIGAWDHGPGFAWRAQSQGSANQCDTTGRGLAIIQIYSTKYRFNSKGNVVAILRRFE